MLDVLLGHWMVVLLILMRVLGMFMVAPFWSGEGIPVIFRVGLAGAAALCLAPTVVARNVLAASYPTTYAFGFAIAEQTVIGMIIGFLAGLYFVVFDASARFYDTQMGMGIVNVIDPFHATEVSVMSQLHSFVAMLIFLSVDGPHYLLVSIQKSFLYVPHLTLHSGALPKAVFALCSKVFYLATMFVMPMLGVLFISHLILAVLSKASPQLNVMILGFPVNLGIGFLTLFWMMDYFGEFIPRVFESLFLDIDRFIVNFL